MSSSKLIWKCIKRLIIILKHLNFFCKNLWWNCRKILPYKLEAHTENLLIIKVCTEVKDTKSLKTMKLLKVLMIVVMMIVGTFGTSAKECECKIVVGANQFIKL